MRVTLREALLPLLDGSRSDQPEGCLLAAAGRIARPLVRALDAALAVLHA